MSFSFQASPSLFASALERSPATVSPPWIISLASRLVIHFNKLPAESLQDPPSVEMSQIRFVTVLKSSSASPLPSSSRGGESAPVVVVKIQESGVGDVALVARPEPIPAASATAVAVAVAPVKPYSPVKRKRKRGIETGVIPGSDEEEEEEEEEEEDEEEEKEREKVHTWEPALSGDGVGAAAQPPVEKDEQVDFAQAAAEGGES